MTSTTNLPRDPTARRSPPLWWIACLALGCGSSFSEGETGTSDGSGPTGPGTGVSSSSTGMATTTSQGGAGPTGGGAAGSGGEAGDVGGGGVGGSGGGFVCDDPAPEPTNETEATATSLGELADEDGAKQLMGVISGARDVDWYRYEGIDAPLGSIDPIHTLTAAAAGMELCVFFECIEDGIAGTTIGCPEGTAVVDSPAGRPGCCHDVGFNVEQDCDGFVTEDDGMNVFIRVRQDGANAFTCSAYSVSYDF